MKQILINVQDDEYEKIVSKAPQLFQGGLHLATLEWCPDHFIGIVMFFDPDNHPQTDHSARDCIRMLARDYGKRIIKLLENLDMMKALGIRPKRNEEWTEVHPELPVEPDMESEAEHFRPEDYQF